MDSKNRGVIPSYYPSGGIEPEYQRLNVTPARSIPFKGPAQQEEITRRGGGIRVNRQPSPQKFVQANEEYQQPSQNRPVEPIHEFHSVGGEDQRAIPMQRPPEWAAEERPSLSDDDLKQMLNDEQQPRYREAPPPAQPLHIGNENEMWKDKKVGNRLDQSSGAELLLNLEPGEHCLLVKSSPFERSQNLQWLLEEGQRLLLSGQCQLDDLSIYTKVALDFGLVIKT